MDTGGVVGTTDIARRLGVTRQAVAYRQAHDPSFPRPLCAVNATEGSVGVWVWRVSDVDEWITRCWRTAVSPADGTHGE